MSKRGRAISMSKSGNTKSNDLPSKKNNESASKKTQNNNENVYNQL